MSEVICACGEGWYDDEEYSSCYNCYLERRSTYISCIFCGRWHSPKYDTCYTCRNSSPGRDEAGRNLRVDILLRDDFTCQNHGCHSQTHPQVDHIEPCAKGGTAVPWNLQVLCRACNQDKNAEYDWRWEQRRIRLMHLYFTFGWSGLDHNERDLLRAEAREYGNEFVWHTHYHDDRAAGPDEGLAWAYEIADKDPTR